MKAAILALAGAAAAVALPEPQLLSGLMGSLGGSYPLVSTTAGKAKYRAEAKRVHLKFGPFKLVGQGQPKPKGINTSMDPNGQAGILTIKEGLCKDCTVLSGRWSLTYANGTEATPADGVYIHHLVSYDTSKRSNNPIGSCGAAGALGGGGLPIAAFVDRGEDSGDTETIFTSPDGKFNSGYQFGKNTALSVQYDLVSYSKETKELFFGLEYEYVPGIVGKDAGHTLKSVTGCGATSPKLDPKGPAVTTSGKMPIKSDATIIWARGHLHAGGDKVDLKLNDKVVCSSVPKYNDANVITSMSTCNNIKVKKGDNLVIEAVYDLTKHKLREDVHGHGDAHGSMGGSDVMGMMAISYAVDQATTTSRGGRGGGSFLGWW